MPQQTKPDSIYKLTYVNTMREETSAGFIVYRDTFHSQSSYLLLQHGKNGHWDFPKGLIEPNEDLLETAVRELFEETGISNSLIEIHETFKEKIEYSYRYQSVLINKQVYYFLAKTHINPRNVRISYEHTGFEWYSHQDALKIVSFENARKLLILAENYLLTQKKKESQ